MDRHAKCGAKARNAARRRAMRCEGAKCSANADGVKCVVSEGVSPVVHAEGDRAALHAPARDSPRRLPRGSSLAPAQASWWSLKKQFKSVFQNVSTVIDCVSCQKCRLHAKVTMLGFGAALKMLLLPHELIQVRPGLARSQAGPGRLGREWGAGSARWEARGVKRRPMWGWSRGECRRGTWARLGRPIRNCPLRAVPQASISRDELVAFVNTLNKFSSAIAHVKELTQARISRAHSATRERRRHTRQRSHSVLSGPALVLRVNGTTCFREPVVATDEPGCPPCSLTPDHPLPASRSSSTTATSCVAPQRCRRCSEAPLPREAVPRARERPQPRWRPSGYPRPPAPRRPPPPPDHHWAPVRASAATIGLALHQ